MYIYTYIYIYTYYWQLPADIVGYVPEIPTPGWLKSP